MERLPIGAPTVRVLLALVFEHEDHGRATVSSVAARVGRTRSATYDRLQDLERLDLVEYGRSPGRRVGAAGSLRPLVRRVPFGRGVLDARSHDSASPAT